MRRPGTRGSARCRQTSPAARCGMVGVGGMETRRGLVGQDGHIAPIMQPRPTAWKQQDQQLPVGMISCTYPPTPPDPPLSTHTPRPTQTPSHPPDQDVRLLWRIPLPHVGWHNGDGALPAVCNQPVLQRDHCVGVFLNRVHPACRRGEEEGTGELIIGLSKRAVRCAGAGQAVQA